MTPERQQLFDDLDAKVKAEAASESDWNAKSQTAKEAADAESAAAASHVNAVAETDAAYKAMRGN